MLGIFHGIHAAAWNEATRDAPETKNDIKESLSKKNFFVFHMSYCPTFVLKDNQEKMYLIEQIKN